MSPTNAVKIPHPAKKCRQFVGYLFLVAKKDGSQCPFNHWTSWLVKCTFQSQWPNSLHEHSLRLICLAFRISLNKLNPESSPDHLIPGIRRRRTLVCTAVDRMVIFWFTGRGQGPKHNSSMLVGSYQAKGPNTQGCCRLQQWPVLPGPHHYWALYRDSIYYPPVIWSIGATKPGFTTASNCSCHNGTDVANNRQMHPYSCQDEGVVWLWSGIERTQHINLGACLCNKDLPEREDHHVCLRVVNMAEISSITWGS
jgi:hypothetical protein